MAEGHSSTGHHIHDRPMRVSVEALRLTGFRNYESASLESGGRHVVLTGENGAGKTNLLEAVSFLSPGRGMRRAKLEQVANQHMPIDARGGWSVFAELDGAMGEVTIGTGVQMTPAGPENQRRIRINQTQVKGSEELLDHLRVVWLTPAMDGLFTGGASDRRRFLDRLVLAIDPSHGRRVSDYERAMRTRNKVLSDPYFDSGILDAVELQLAALGTAIASARAELVSLVSSLIVETHDPASPFPDAVLHVEGHLEESISEIAASDLEARFLSDLRNSRRADQAAGRTLAGPHRSDLSVTHRPKAMAAHYCSTGEQKALLVGIILAHARLVSRMHGFAPVMLLDEIAAHIDEGRRAALFSMIDELGCQAWMTGTDRALFEAVGKAGSHFEVSAGSIKQL